MVSVGLTIRMKYLRWVQLHKNIRYYTAIKMTPYEAVYYMKTSSSLAHFGILQEHWNQIDAEEDLNDYQDECQGRGRCSGRINFIPHIWL